MNAVISDTKKAAILGMQILEIPARRKFVSSVCHAHSIVLINTYQLTRPL